MRIKVLKTGLATLAAGTALAMSLAVPAQAEIVGTLQCAVSAGMGVIVVSQRAVSCTYKSAVGPAERYTGSISRLGVDIGLITGGTLVYDAYVAGTPAPGALGGTYLGAGFGLTVGSGAGLNALVGGNGNSITLQPISATTSTGLNVNAGVGALRLTYAGTDTPMKKRHRRHHRH